MFKIVKDSLCSILNDYGGFFFKIALNEYFVHAITLLCQTTTDDTNTSCLYDPIKNQLSKPNVAQTMSVLQNKPANLPFITFNFVQHFKSLLNHLQRHLKISIKIWFEDIHSTIRRFEDSIILYMSDTFILLKKTISKLRFSSLRHMWT